MTGDAGRWRERDEEVATADDVVVKLPLLFPDEPEEDRILKVGQVVLGTDLGLFEHFDDNVFQLGRAVIHHDQR